DLKIRSGASSDITPRIKNDVGHQRNAPAEFVAKQTKDECADRAHHQRQCDRKRDFGNAFSEIMADRNKHECDQKKIQRIERPTEEARDEWVALLTIQSIEEDQRLHE